MKKVEIKDRDCNYCGRKCGGDIVRNKRGDGVKTWLICPGWMLPADMRTSLLERASENDGSFQALNVILEKLNLRYQEVGRYPYFKFIPTD